MITVKKLIEMLREHNPDFITTTRLTWKAPVSPAERR